ncbi:hypothetical protein X963_5665 [Burkholderia pseudomallei MSHR7498]|nr:hypothetical protein X963_5665 [Burkholderia pseudomallei MSHR7498]
MLPPDGLPPPPPGAAEDELGCGRKRSKFVLTPLVHRAARSGKTFNKPSAITVTRPAVMIGPMMAASGFGLAAAEMALS